MVDRPGGVLDLPQGGASVASLASRRLALLVVALAGGADLSLRLGDTVARWRLAAVLAGQFRAAFEFCNPRLQIGNGCLCCRVRRRAVRQLCSQARVLRFAELQFRAGLREVHRKLAATGALGFGW